MSDFSTVRPALEERILSMFKDEMFDGFTQLMALQELVFVFELFGKTHLAVHKAKKKRKRSKENNMLRHTGNG